jgi:hypothetical protein
MVDGIEGFDEINKHSHLSLGHRPQFGMVPKGPLAVSLMTSHNSFATIFLRSSFVGYLFSLSACPFTHS